MGCTCVRPSHEHLFSDFIKAIRIKSTNPSDLASVLKNKKQKFDLLLKNNLINPDQQEVQGAYYRDIYTKVESDQNEKAAFYISLLFVCIKDITGLKKGLKDLNGLVNDKIKIESDNFTIERKFLIAVLQYYVRQMTNYIITHISSQTSDKEHFESHFKSLYNDKVIESYVESIMTEFKEEQVNMNDFLNDKMIDKLKDDHSIRVELEKLSISTPSVI